jgi:SAM-dependent methyltransferase
MTVPNDIRSAIRDRFTNTAVAPAKVKKFPLGPDSAKSLGYDADEIDGLPSSVTESFCGVGNPLRLGELQTGQTVLDLGSGAGLDSILAAHRVGPTGKVIGVDMTEAMIEKARSNAAVVGLSNVQFIHTEIDNIPLDDESVDVTITNGVFNLCTDKPKVLAEVFRVLRPAGHVQMADILLHDNVTPKEVATKGSWSD